MKEKIISLELQHIRETIRQRQLTDEDSVLQTLAEQSAITAEQRSKIQRHAAELITQIRADDKPSLLDVFLAEYGLSTEEGVALMCLAEALMRVPDSATIDDLIEDKVAPSAWDKHKSQSNSLLVNASTLGLLVTGKILKPHEKAGISGTLKGMVRRLGEPVIRLAIKRAMKELGGQFVLGESIEQALQRGKKNAAAGYTYSYDMLGEAALTQQDADSFFAEYQHAIKALAAQCKHNSIADNPGISIKLSALHPRYEVGQKERVTKELTERVHALALQAKQANMGLNVDAEEADRLDLSLDIIESVLRDPQFAGWDGFGVVVQAYGKSATSVIEWLYQAACQYDRKVMVRLVKGAYWDTEIKRAQEIGQIEYPVFTRKVSTDSSYIFCAEKLLAMTDRIYPQFATHNANSIATILNLATPGSEYELQRLHGMGEIVHRLVFGQHDVRCRIYAPVGPHKELLAYLVRRLLENGANSSFVNQLTDVRIPAEVLAPDSIERALADIREGRLPMAKPPYIYRDNRQNSKGWDLHHSADIAHIEKARTPFRQRHWTAGPLLVAEQNGTQSIEVNNPADRNDVVGTLYRADIIDVQQAIDHARPWTTLDAAGRAQVLIKTADLFEEHFGEFFALLTREAGKTVADAIAEVREAVDFLRYYAIDCIKHQDRDARGIFTCISPWNFPLAIFTGQVAAALAAGNAVLAKPAEQTSLVAHVAVKLMHEAGVPVSALQFVPGRGREVGTALIADTRIAGVCFTGSTGTAHHISRTMADHCAPDAPLIAETGGLNAMVVDSTALPEQAVKDIVASAFQSAGQRCSALRMLYLQEDIAQTFITMLEGAVRQQQIGSPWNLHCDIGPVVSDAAKAGIDAHIQKAQDEGRIMLQLPCPDTGSFVGPTMIRVNGISDLKEEIFGPVLHIATFKSHELDSVIHDINATGYGLTFGLHTRIDGRVTQISDKINVGNMYVNRNQIGAIVGSQPFGGEGLSGTGPKAGGPNYVARFTREKAPEINDEQPQDLIQDNVALSFGRVQALLHSLGETPRLKLESHEQDGPTGESNILSYYGRGVVLCLGPSLVEAEQQARVAEQSGCVPVVICPGADRANAISGTVNPEDLSVLSGFNVVAYWRDVHGQKALRKALSLRDGAIIPLVTCPDQMPERLRLERHVCINTTASGGNVALLAAN